MHHTRKRNATEVTKIRLKQPKPFYSGCSSISYNCIRMSNEETEHWYYMLQVTQVTSTTPRYPQASFLIIFDLLTNKFCTKMFKVHVIGTFSSYSTVCILKNV